MGILEEYKSCLCTIRQLSWDKERKQSLIDDDEKSHKMYNFDGIKKKMCKRFRGDNNSSCDAYWERSGIRYLIEFKNQSEGNIDRRKMWNKAYDSAALLLLNEGITREQMVENTVLIVVYNNSNYIRDNSSYSPSTSWDKFGRKVKGLAKISEENEFIINFELSTYIGYMYREVYTLNVQDFVNVFYPKFFPDS